MSFRCLDSTRWSLRKARTRGVCSLTINGKHARIDRDATNANGLEAALQALRVEFKRRLRYEPNCWAKFVVELNVENGVAVSHASSARSTVRHEPVRGTEQPAPASEATTQ